MTRIDAPVDLDVDALLRPLRDGDGSANSDGCGVDLQYDAVYDRLRLARQVDQRALPTGVWERHSPRKVDWVRQCQIATDVLSERSKDLQVAAWLVEALVYQHGLPGLAQGVPLFVELCQRHWLGIHPRIEEADAGLRVRPIEWLLRETVRWQNLGLLAPSEEVIEGGAREVTSMHWHRIDAALNALADFLCTHVADQGPSFQEILSLTGAQCMAFPPPPMTQGADTAPAETPAPRPVQASASSRDEAYDQLREIALVLARLEPHSPVPGVLMGLTTWRNARFEDLLEQLPAGGPSVYDLVRLFSKTPTTP